VSETATSPLVYRRPEVVAAADWSINAAKRRIVTAELQGDVYLVAPAIEVQDPPKLIAGLREKAGLSGTAFVGFDFPIGLPEAYAERAGFRTFREALGVVGRQEGWRDFFINSDAPSVRQPFFPRSAATAGPGARQRLAGAMGIADFSSLLRKCEARTSDRAAAQCLFFTLGAKQVGRAACDGWSTVLQPALATVALWPFDGELEALLRTPGVVVGEIYPAEAYRHVGVRFAAGHGEGKGSKPARVRAFAHRLTEYEGGQIRLSEGARDQISSGFDSDDDFDAMAGLLSMLDVVCGPVMLTAPASVSIRTIEGWILGQPPTDEGIQQRKNSVRLADDFRDNLIIDRYDPVFKRMRGRKLAHLRSENSEDVITWNVFRSLRQIDPRDWLPQLTERAVGLALPCEAATLSLWSSLGPPPALIATGAEGRSEVDVIIEAPSWVWVIEAKYKSDISLGTTVRSNRDQILRNIDVGSRYSGSRDFYFSLLVVNAEQSSQGSARIAAYQDIEAVRRALREHRPDGLQNLKAVTLLRWSDVARVLRQASEGAKRIDERIYADRALRWLTERKLFDDHGGRIEVIGPVAL
jgi:hypothetical protein